MEALADSILMMRIHEAVIKNLKEGTSLNAEAIARGVQFGDGATLRFTAPADAKDTFDAAVGRLQEKLPVEFVGNGYIGAASWSRLAEAMNESELRFKVNQSSYSTGKSSYSGIER